MGINNTLKTLKVKMDDSFSKHAAAKEIWINIPDGQQNYRSLDLRFATIDSGLLYDIFTALWGLYSEHIDTQRK